MTELYKNAGNYWPDANNDVFDGVVDEIHMETEHVFEEITSPSIGVHPQDYEFEIEEGEEEEEEEFFEDRDIDVIYEDETNSSSNSMASESLMADNPMPQPSSRLFTEELEMLLTNVDGDDSDPEVVIIPEVATGRPKRIYRKSMSLPMSPIGGARERLDSINISEFLFSPLKLGALDQDVDFEHISPNNDFNLINFVGQDPVFSPLPTPVANKESPVKKPPPKEEKPRAISKGKCLDLLRATHQRQENMVKRFGAIEKQKLSKGESEKNKKPVMPRKLNLDPARDNSDPDWSPLHEVLDTKARRGQSSSSSHNQKSKETAKTNHSKRTQDVPKSHVVSASSNQNNSNLSEIKRRFLANIPLVASGSVAKGKVPPQERKVIRTDVPIVPTDHNYCSPVKRVQPIAKIGFKPSKTTILISDAVPLKSSTKRSRKMEKSTVVEAEKPAESSQVSLLVPSKKKRAINLQDYKKLRSEENQAKKPSDAFGKVKLENEETLKKSPVASLQMNHAPSPKYVDPISEAKNKALRIQERRRAARMKQEEIKLKTPLVPILPLAVMTGLMSEETYLAELRAGDAKDKSGAVDTCVKDELPFEEIMIVSVGCNTNTSIRPDYVSQALLSNLPTNAPLTSNSLLFSIQDAVIKKTTSSSVDSEMHSHSSKSPVMADYSPGKPEGANERTTSDHSGYQHGEDKVIMHLRKDRIRPKTFSIGCQTVPTPEFPELSSRKAANKRHYRRRSLSSSSSSSRDSDSYSERSRSPSDSSDYSRSSEDEEDEDEYGRSSKRRRLYSNRSRSRSCRRSRSRETQCRYRSRSRSPYRRSWNRNSVDSRSRSRSPSYSMGRSSRNNNRWKKNNPSPEERKIVYVGRLGTDVTKEDLREKFTRYGTVKLVTLHEKANGTRYGFVTFEEPSEAFKAIESAKDDPRLKMYDIGFGGRRAFCGASYADLDNVETEEDMYGGPPAISTFTEPEESFESLLQSFKRKVAAVAP